MPWLSDQFRYFVTNAPVQSFSPTSVVITGTDFATCPTLADQHLAVAHPLQR